MRGKLVHGKFGACNTIVPITSMLGARFDRIPLMCLDGKT